MKTMLLIGVLALLGFVCFLVDRAHRRQLVRRMKDRPPMNDDEFGRLFPVDQAPIAIRIRQLLGRWVDIDLANVAPTDEFCQHLGLGRTDGMDVDDFVADVEKDFHIEFPDSEAQKMRTLQDMVEFIASTKQKQESGEHAVGR